MSKSLEQSSDILLVAGEAVEGFRDHDVKLTWARTRVI